MEDTVENPLAAPDVLNADNAAEKELATAQQTIAALEEQVSTLKQAASTTASGEASGTAK